MYTDDMRRAFRSITPPPNFSVDIIDENHFITVAAQEATFMRLTDEDKRRAIEYMARVKDALEQNGAIVLLVRQGGKDE